MKIRSMQADDYTAVDYLMQDVHRLHLRARPDIFIPLEHPYSREEYAKMISSDDMICLLAEEGGKTAGICFVSMRSKSGMLEMPIAYMEDLCVDTTFRHCGVGKALFRKAEQLAKEKGAHRLDLMVWDFNKDAMRFYESLGLAPQRHIFEKEL